MSKKSKLISIFLGICIAILAITHLITLFKGDGNVIINGIVIESKILATIIVLLLYLTLWGLATLGIYSSDKLKEKLF